MHGSLHSVPLEPGHEEGGSDLLPCSSVDPSLHPAGTADISSLTLLCGVFTLFFSINDSEVNVSHWRIFSLSLFLCVPVSVSVSLSLSLSLSLFALRYSEQGFYYLQ